MEAEFRHPRRRLEMGLLALALFYVVSMIRVRNAGGNIMLLSIMFLLHLGGAAMLETYTCLKRGMWLCVRDGRMEGRTPLRRRLSLPNDRVAYAFVMGNVLFAYDTNGRQYVFPDIENAMQIYEEILALIVRDDSTEEAAARLREELRAFRRRRLRKILLVAAAALCMFGSIAVGVIGTGGRDFPDMTARDWRITSCVAVTFALSLAAMLIFDSRAGKDSLRIQRTEWRLRGVTAFLAPMPAENVIAAYVDRSHSGRIVFYQAAEGVHMHFDRILGEGKLRDDGEYPEALDTQEALLEKLHYGSVASFEEEMIRIR